MRGPFSFSIKRFALLLQIAIGYTIIKTNNPLRNKRGGTRRSILSPEAPAAPEEPTTKVCPYCQNEISIKAVRCPHCTSKLEGFPEMKA